MPSVTFIPRKEKTFYSILILVTGASILGLIFHRSSEPFVLGFYSLPYFVFLVMVVALVFLGGVLIYCFRIKPVSLVYGSAIAMVVGLVLTEAVGQAYAFFHPSYQVLWLEPDKAIGWKITPHLRWTWTGRHWYAMEFSVPVESNSHGFRDIERNFEKSPGVRRIALLGDSFVEALQVPFDKTAGNLLERKLNLGKTRYEVLNFGVSSYSVGQYLLTWEEYASKFAIDYVFIFVAERPMERTTTHSESGHSSENRGKSLWVRPSFRIERGTLIREPAKDFEEFVKLQQKVIHKSLLGRGIRKRRRGFFIKTLFPQLLRCGQIYFFEPLMTFQRRFSDSSKNFDVSVGLSTQGVDDETFQVNLKVIETLGREVHQEGGQLVIVDATRYFTPPSARLSTSLERFSKEKQLGYIPLWNDLLASERNGIATRWADDGHFNEAGNEVFAEAMYRWLKHVEI